MTFPFFDFIEAAKKEKQWLINEKLLLPKESLENEFISWAGYMASNTVESPPVTTSGLLPLFHEKGANFGMLKHGIVVIMAAVEKLNPGQIPVITGDQPIFALLKLVQSRYLNLHDDLKK